MKELSTENKQLRALMSEYLKEIDQIRYAYTKLRNKYSKEKLITKSLKKTNFELT